MDPDNIFSLVEFNSVTEQVNLCKSTIWRRVNDGQFPKPVGGRKRACWSKIQIVDYLYQLSRYGNWTEVRTNEVLDAAHANALNISRNISSPIADTESGD